MATKEVKSKDGLKVLWHILRLSLIGGLVNLDDVPLFQIMISQPIVAAPIIGCLGGDFRVGLIIGGFLELLMICFLPIGCLVHLDYSLASIVATGTTVLTRPYFNGSTEALIALSVLLSLPFSIFAQEVSIFVRKLNGKLSDLAHQAVASGGLGKIQILHLSGLVLFYLRSFLLCLVSLLVMTFIVKSMATWLYPGIKRGLELIYFIYPVIGIALILDVFRNKSMYILFVLSFISSLIFSAVFGFPGWISLGLSCLLWGLVYIGKVYFKQSGQV